MIRMLKPQGISSDTIKQLTRMRSVRREREREIYLTELGGHHFLNWTKGDFVSFVDQKMAEMARVEVFLCDWDVNLRKKRAKGS
jgi:hypothetical protein